MGGRAAVLVSGSGTNLQALLDHPLVGPSIVVVVSDRSGVPALGRAERQGVRTVTLEPDGATSRDDYDRRLLDVLRADAVDAVLLAGFMRVLGPLVIHAFVGRILNVHPALLPAFPGMHAERQALDWGVRVTGVTVHVVDEQVDHGPVVLQEPVIVLPEDDEASLHRRVQEVEHRLFPRAAALLLEGRLRIEGRHVLIEPGTGDGVPP